MQGKKRKTPVMPHIDSETERERIEMEIRLRKNWQTMPQNTTYGGKNPVNERAKKESQLHTAVRK